MFLALTSDQRFWNRNRQILFLGEWCKLYNQKDVWSVIDSETLPYHWDDREQLYKDYHYLTAIYEKYLTLLADRLNQIHSVNYSLRYWRILIGPWLYHLVTIIYDRYRSICIARDSSLVMNTWIMPCDNSIAFKDISEFMSYCTNSDRYNQHLFSQIIRCIEPFPYEELSIEFILDRPKEVLKKNVKNQLFNIYNRMVPDRYNKIVFISGGLTIYNQVRLQLALKQWPYFRFERLNVPSQKVDLDMRQKLHMDDAESVEFEKVLQFLTVECLPTIYLEGYTEMWQSALAACPKRCQSIVTTTSYNTDEGFKFWAAHQTEQGTKLVVTQHGGLYGCVKWSAIEDHEIAISDQYYTWGWLNLKKPKAIPLSATRLTNLPKNIYPNPEGNILWVGMSLPRYAYSMFSAPMGPQSLIYFDEQVKFFRAANPPVTDLLLLRLYQHDYGWNQKERWQDLAPDLQIYQGQKSMVQQLADCRLAVTTYNATTYLETMAINFPTVIFWNPNYWELRLEAQPLFDKLYEVGILHYTPESAANHVNQIYKNPSRWWQSWEIQEIRKEFCYYFARVSSTWLPEWKDRLLSL